MEVKVLLVPLLVLFKSFLGVCVQEIYVKAGEMVVLQCPNYRGKVTWTTFTPKERDLSNLSSAEQEEMGVLLQDSSLVLLRASGNHEGNYSCCLRRSGRPSWFSVTVYTNLSRECEERIQYPMICSAQESCTLTCPDANTPDTDTLNFTSNGIVWHKEGKSLLKDRFYFSKVEEKDGGLYTCTRSYLYHGQIYNMSFTVDLEVQPYEKPNFAEITSPRDNEVVYVELGSRKEINCEAFLYSDTNIFWLSDGSFLEKNVSLPVFYTQDSSRENDTERIYTTARLVFQKVSKEDLSKHYTCKLESLSQSSGFVTITLALEAQPSYLSLALCIVGIAVMMLIIVVTYLKFKIEISLFLRDSLGFHRSPLDGKTYDAFLICYKSDTNTGLNDDDKKWFENVLEHRFGYDLCLFDRDVPPGKAVAEAVLDCIEQCRTVVLVPTSLDPGLGSGLLSAVHAALVERKTCLVFIKTGKPEAVGSGSSSEALQLLSTAGRSVTWEGSDSMAPSSSFWKQLRYHLPATTAPSRLFVKMI
ncbi:interleukin-1 receptor-like 1 [Aulostomus maculatus]